MAHVPIYSVYGSVYSRLSHKVPVPAPASSMTFGVLPQVVVVYPVQALSVRRLKCITVCAKDEFFMIYYTSCNVFADLHRCLAQIFGGFAAKNEEAEATFVTRHLLPLPRKPAPETVGGSAHLKEFTSKITFILHIFLQCIFQVFN